ncbi:DHH family phosphoesterase [Peptostreptococcus russellii]|uniref:Cyclic-di-AMP phosphodiesterase n=1 Tax=Peptostreptococcus russellii TaxID=215200 RepID=A0A1H8KA56_9FIRM|nr:DHH family phosphoesterase [Peptostreptococcus russellii]SEN89794.1 c-di-AMP phosphodiesterase, consists of a GGDEF-like and DHH domains [Peptostreptococcus russellii]
MSDKNRKYCASSYLNEISFVIILILSLYAIFKSRFVGTIGILACIILVLFNYRVKEASEEKFRKKIKDISFDLDKITKTTMLMNPIPLSVVELDGKIFWSNIEFDKMVGMDAEESSIGNKIEDLVGDITLRKVLDEKKVMEDEYEFNNRKYILKYCFAKSDYETDGSAEYKAIVYWIDKTDYENLELKYENSREVVMNIEIDGYEDVLKSTPEENRPIITMDIEKLLSNLETDTQGLMRKTGTDKYVLFMRKKALKELEKTKFSILDKAREIDYGNSLPVSLSIGVGYDGDTVEQTGEFASGAIDMALGRGGDQVAIKNKDGFNFYGGKSKGFERKTKVKSRLIGLALRELINQSDKIIIMGHKYPDMDAMGAAVGVFDICKSYGKIANIVLEGVNEAVEMFVNRIHEEKYYNGMFISHEKAIDMCDKDTLIVVVDTHRPSYTECPELLDISKRLVVIDHHRRGVEYISDTVLLFHEIYVSSTCEMVTELIQYTDYDIKINKLTAEGLLGGIYLDTKNFEFKTGVRTFEAASYLRNVGADTLAVKKFFNSYAEDFVVKAEVIQRTEIIDDRICLSYARQELENINIVIAKAADELLNIKNIEASFVLGMKGDTVFVSARSLGNVNVHVLMEKIGGGGHIDIAGAQIRDVSLSQAYDMVKDVIEEYLEEEEEKK